MGSTLVSSPLIVQSQTDDISLLQQSITSALNNSRNKMSTSMATGNRRKQKHSSVWMNLDDYSTVSVTQSTTGVGSSPSSSGASDMTLPTPPRSPNASNGFDDTIAEYDDEEEYSTSQGIPEPLLDDLLELWCEEADFTSGENTEEISIHNALTELGFDSLVSNDGQNDGLSETEQAENMIDHLLASCKASYLSPPPTNPSSPKMQADSEFEEPFVLSSVKSEMPESSSSSSSSVSEEFEEEIITGEIPTIENEEEREIKIEPTDEGSSGNALTDEEFGQHDDVIQNMISEGFLNYEIDEQFLAMGSNIDDTYTNNSATQAQAVSEMSASAAKSVEKLLDSFKSEPKDEVDDDSYDLFGGPKSKKRRYDLEDEFLSEIPDIKQDCMWNGFLDAEANLTSPTANLLGDGNWKQEYTFETLFEEKEKFEGDGTSTTGNTAVDHLKAAQKEAEAAAAAIAAAEEAKKKRQLEEFRIAFDNDHRYALTYDDRYAKEVVGPNKSKTMSASASSQPRKVIQGIIVKSEPQADKAGGGAAPKKTKILVPLKDLMETLQQKSFLVSPLGPNKKIIRFTGSDSVKGVLNTASFQSAIISGSSSSGSRTISTTPSKPNHNVRKRPHNLKTPKIEITPALSPMEDSSSSSIISSSAVSSSTSSSSSSSNSSSSSSSSTTTKKKTKAHNNMERMRRIDLRNSFDNLKKLVPPLAKIPKCSKVEILRRAEEYIKGLRNQEKRLQKEEMQVRQRNAQLRSRLEQASSSMNALSNNNSSILSSISCSN